MLSLILDLLLELRQVGVQLLDLPVLVLELTLKKSILLRLPLLSILFKRSFQFLQLLEGAAHLCLVVCLQNLPQAFHLICEFLSLLFLLLFACCGVRLLLLDWGRVLDGRLWCGDLRLLRLNFLLLFLILFGWLLLVLFTLLSLLFLLV